MNSRPWCIFLGGKKKPLTRYFSLLKNPFWICEKWCIKSITGAWSLVSKSPKMNTSDYYISCQNTSSIQHLVKLRSLSGVFANYLVFILQLFCVFSLDTCIPSPTSSKLHRTRFLSEENKAWHVCFFIKICWMNIFLFLLWWFSR